MKQADLIERMHINDSSTETKAIEGTYSPPPQPRCVATDTLD